MMYFSFQWLLTISLDVDSCTVVEHAVVVRREDVDGRVEPGQEHHQPQKEPDDTHD